MRSSSQERCSVDVHLFFGIREELRAGNGVVGRLSEENSVD